MGLQRDFLRQDRLKDIVAVNTDDGLKLVLDKYVAECVNNAWFLTRVEEEFDIQELGLICLGGCQTSEEIEAAKRHMLIAVMSIGPSGHRRYSRRDLEDDSAGYGAADAVLAF